MKITSIIKAALVAAAFYGAVASAQTYTYNPGDLLAAFRQTGSPDLIVDLGSVSQFQQPNGTSPVNLTGVSSALASTYGSLNGLYWSVFTYVGTTSSLGSANTLWLSDPRSDVNIQTAAPRSASFNSQGYVIGEMSAIVDATKSGFATIIADQAVQLSSGLNEGGDPISYTVGVGTYGDFNGTLRGTVENYTGVSFVSGSSVSDLYQQNPGTANLGTYLGDFSLESSGSFTFNPVPEPSTWAMLGAGMMTLFAIRRFGRNE
jgi:hypothetical protein